MLPTFVIGLREGLEAALIVGIVAAFLRQRGRLDLLRWAFVGVGAAIVLCLAAGIALKIVSEDLPQTEQEGLETVIGAVAVCMVTYMVVWMRRHSRTLKHELEGAAGAALAAGSGFALVLMAFLAVLREGLETVVFLLAAFNQSGNTGLAATGAVLGIVLAIVLGWGIYRGGVKLNLAKFFRFTGIVLVFVAAGLVVSALHTAHEAHWLNIGQEQVLDLSALVEPGSVQAALLTGMLGLQPKPVLIELIGWLVYLVPVLLYVVVPPGRGLAEATVRRILAVGGALAVAGAIVLTVLTPGHPGRDPQLQTASGVRAQVESASPSEVTFGTTVLTPAQSSAVGPSQLIRAAAHGTEDRLGIATRVYGTTLTGPVAGAPTTMTFTELATRNGGRLPLGANRGDGVATASVQTTSANAVTVWVEPATGRIIDLQWSEKVTLTAQLAIGPTSIGTPKSATWQLSKDDATAAAASARADRRELDRRTLFSALAITGWVAAGLCVVIVAALVLVRRRRGPESEPTDLDFPAAQPDSAADPSANSNGAEITRQSELTRG